MRTIIQLVAALGLIAPAAGSDLVAPQVSTLRLQANATARGETVTLADVLDFSQADARLVEAIGAQPVLTMPADSAVLELSHEQIVKRLAELGVNMTRVLVNGALVCRVVIGAAPSDEAAAPPPEPPLLLAPGGAAPPAEQTLGDAIRTFAQRELAPDGGRVEVVFERAGQEFVQLTSPPFEFSIQAERGPRLGLREFRVSIRREGRKHDSLRISADVRLIRRVIVAARPLNIGGYISRDAIDFAERIFTADEADAGFTQPEQIVGQRVARFVAAGEMLKTQDVESADMVKRSRPVSVVSSGPVAVRAVGVALDSGGYGESVRVRLGESRKDRREVRGVVVGVGTVQLAEGGL